MHLLIPVQIASCDVHDFFLSNFCKFFLFFFFVSFRFVYYVIYTFPFSLTVLKLGSSKFFSMALFCSVDMCQWHRISVSAQMAATFSVVEHDRCTTLLRFASVVN